MDQRLLLNRVNTKTTGPAIGGQYNLAILALSHEAQTSLVFVQLGKARTQIAVNMSVWHFVPGMGWADQLSIGNPSPENHFF